MEKERMQWVDAMRGFSMLIVVLGHVLLSMGIGGYSSFLSSVLLTFRMPLFFFVSGFFSYRAIQWWNRQRICDILKRKLQAQVLCTLVFLSVYQLAMTGRIDLANGFGGYWFTIVLFQMYILYLAVSLVSRLMKFNIVIPLLVAISAIFIVLLVFYNRDSWLYQFLCWENLAKYMQFFTLGIVCSKYRHRLFQFLGSNVFIMIMVIGWIVSMLLWYDETFKSQQPLIYSFIHDIAVRYFALFTVIIMFFSNKDRFSQEAKYSLILRFIGQRTLDIYMVHYFLLPHMPWMSEWLAKGNMIIPQIIISSILTATIVALSLLASSILRKSKIMETWLFGVKRKVIV